MFKCRRFKNSLEEKKGADRVKVTDLVNIPEIHNIPVKKKKKKTTNPQHTKEEEEEEEEEERKNNRKATLNSVKVRKVKRRRHDKRKLYPFISTKK